MADSTDFSEAAGSS